MTYNEIRNIANKLDKETQKRIEKEVDERLEILKEGDLDEESMGKMEECLYIALVLQEYLNGEYEILEEEKSLLLEEMESMYNEYGDILARAKIEEKVSKKKRMALELMKIREELMSKKENVKDVNTKIKENRENNEKLKELSSKDNMRDIMDKAKRAKELEFALSPSAFDIKKETNLPQKENKLTHKETKLTQSDQQKLKEQLANNTQRLESYINDPIMDNLNNLNKTFESIPGQSAIKSINNALLGPWGSKLSGSNYSKKEAKEHNELNK